MNGCLEFLLDDLTAVTAIPVGNIPAASAGSVANCLAPTVPSAPFVPEVPDLSGGGSGSQEPGGGGTTVRPGTVPNPVYAGAITVGMRAPADGVTLVPIRRGTGRAKDDEGDGTAGRLHTVTVTVEADDRDAAAWAALLALERTPRHLLLTFRGGARAFVSATRDTYLCTVERDGSKTSVQFRVQDLMGIQLLA